MSKTYLFYATRDDLLVVTGKIESIVAIKYVRFGNIARSPECFSMATEIPNLGIASHPSAVACDKYLIIVKPRGLKAVVNLESISKNSIVSHEIAAGKATLKKPAGTDRFIIDQLLNPDTITFTVGGLWNNEILLHGSVGTASQSKSSQMLMRVFHDALNKQFVKVRAFYVGPQALELLKNGKRLTISAQSPQQFDLKPL